MGLHHLMIGTWTPPGAIFTVQFDDEKLELKLIKKTEIPKDEPISWMTFDVSCPWAPETLFTVAIPERTDARIRHDHSTPKRTSTAPP